MCRMEEDRVARLRRLRYRAGRRGTREMDLLLGRFADHALDGMNERELGEFEELLGYPDPLLHAWITGQAGGPAGGHEHMITRIRLFHAR